MKRLRTIREIRDEGFKVIWADFDNMKFYSDWNNTVEIVMKPKLRVIVKDWLILKYYRTLRRIKKIIFAY